MIRNKKLKREEDFNKKMEEAQNNQGDPACSWSESKQAKRFERTASKSGNKKRKQRIKTTNHDKIQSWNREQPMGDSLGRDDFSKRKFHERRC